MTAGLTVQWSILVWLLMIQLIVPSPAIYTCINLHFHFWELMLYKVELGEDVFRETEDGKVQNGV